MSQGSKKSERRRRNRRESTNGRRIKLALVAAVAVATTAVVFAALNATPPAATYVRPTDAAPITSTPAAEVAPTTVTVARGDDPLPVLFIGDSLTGNLHASTEDAGFRPTMLRSMESGGEVIETQGFRVGASTAEVSGLADIGEDQALAIVELGTNNVGQTSIEEFTVEYSSLLAAIRESSPDAQLVCAGVWQAPGIGDPFDAVIEAECTALGGAFRPLSDLHVQQVNRGPAGKTDVFGAPSDNFHPNDEGYKAIADRLLGAVTFS
jgi:acyl-CoA thioesterase-1